MEHGKVHPWDGEIDDWCVVSGSGLRVRRFATESEARDFAETDNRPHPGDYIHAVYGPGTRNRVAVYMDGTWYTPEAFDRARGF